MAMLVWIIAFCWAYELTFRLPQAGVLVIAFPVSVFSDLWSKELSTRGAFNALMEEQEDNDDELSAKLPESPRSLYTNGSRARDHVSNASGLAVSANPLPDFDRDTVVFAKEDLNSIVAHMNRISESQRELRSILKKYKQY